MVMSTFHVVSAFRLGAMATVIAALSACAKGGSGREDSDGAGPQPVSSGEASVNDQSDRVPVRVDAWSESEPLTDSSLTQGEKDLLARQVSGCWKPLVDDIDAAESSIGLKISMNRDGTVQRLEILDQGKMAESRSLQALAESAIKAVIGCMPLKLPSDKYDQWRLFVVYFDVGPLVQR